MYAIFRFRALIACLAIPVVGGFAAAMLSGNQKEVYAALTLPSFAPPASVFGIVWTILYLLMGLACYLVYKERSLSRGDRRAALAVYAAALLANWLWSILFFRFLLFTLSAWWIVFIFVLTALCAVLFYRIRKLAGVLVAPTLLWLLFAGVLNFYVAAWN